jgi:hypothetical protein
MRAMVAMDEAALMVGLTGFRPIPRPGMKMRVRSPVRW